MIDHSAPLCTSNADGHFVFEAALVDRHHPVDGGEVAGEPKRRFVFLFGFDHDVEVDAAEVSNEIEKGNDVT